MKQKSETFHMLVHFFNQINRQFKTNFLESILVMGTSFFPNFKLFVQTMVLNFFLKKFKQGFMNMELFTNVVVS